jgi:hypothetical protein
MAQAGSGPFIERELRIIVTPGDGGQQRGRELHASWQLDGANRVSGELRSRGSGTQPGPVIGHITVSWRSLTDTLGDTPVIGWFAKRTRSLQDMAGLPDPADVLGLVETEFTIEIDETVFGRPIRRSARAETRNTQWIVRTPADWWERVTIFRAGIPIPTEFPEA